MAVLAQENSATEDNHMVAKPCELHYQAQSYGLYSRAAGDEGRSAGAGRAEPGCHHQSTNAGSARSAGGSENWKHFHIWSIGSHPSSEVSESSFHMTCTN